MTERTTIRLPQELLSRAKRKAVAEHRTLTSLIEERLRLLVSEHPKGIKTSVPCLGSAKQRVVRCRESTWMTPRFCKIWMTLTTSAG